MSNMFIVIEWDGKEIFIIPLYLDYTVRLFNHGFFVITCDLLDIKYTCAILMSTLLTIVGCKRKGYVIIPYTMAIILSNRKFM